MTLFRLFRLYRSSGYGCFTALRFALIATRRTR